MPGGYREHPHLGDEDISMGKCVQSWRICVNPAMRAGLAEARVFGRDLAIVLGIGSGVQAGAGDVVVASGGGFCRARGAGPICRWLL
jgi:hypothetical protein